MNRRAFLKLTAGGIAAAIAAPYVITTPGLLMKVRATAIWKPTEDFSDAYFKGFTAVDDSMQNALNCLAVFGWVVSRNGRVLPMKEAAKLIHPTGALQLPGDVAFWDIETRQEMVKPWRKE